MNNHSDSNLQEELESLRLALEAAGIRSVSDPQKIGIEISHLIRRASVNALEAQLVSTGKMRFFQTFLGKLCSVWGGVIMCI